MADLPSPSIPSQPADHLDYRPVSAWAILSLVLGLVFAILVVGSFLFAVYEGNPVYLPGWVVILALAGAGIAYFSERQVRASEGTRVGVGLARWGLWLCVLSGIGYFAFSYFTLLALSRQANAFLMVKEQNSEGQVEAGFFPLLLSNDPADLNRAFLLTVPPSNRNGNPADEIEMTTLFDVAEGEAGRLSKFRAEPLVRILSNTDAAQARVEPLGIQKWEYDKGSYRIVRNYRIATVETLMEISLPVQSTEPGEETDRRKWTVALPQAEKYLDEPTPIGKGLQRARATLYVALEKWTRSLEATPLRDDTAWEKIMPKDSMREHVRKLYKETFQGSAVGKVTLFPPTADFGTWKKVDDRLQFQYPIGFFAYPKGDIPPYVLDGALTAETKGPVDITDPGNPSWQLVSLKWTRASVPERPKMPDKKGMPRKQPPPK